jgi:hypothetical protein
MAHPRWLSIAISPHHWRFCSHFCREPCETRRHLLCPPVLEALMRAPSLTATLIDARHLLRIGSQGDLGERLGSSRRTGQRWESVDAIPSTLQLHSLVSRV